MKFPTTLADEIRTCFSANYISARDLFRKTVDAVAMPKSILTLPMSPELTTEAAWIGSPDAERVLVLISATHGVEGIVGAAIQQDFLERLCPRPLIPPQTSVLLVFALNPHGFVHNRRCDADGIDLNRNFINFHEPLPDNPGYIELMDAIYRPDAERGQRLAAYRKAHGNTAFEIAISGGQYSDPLGPFYGGHAPGHGNRATEEIISHYQLNGRQIAVVDIHTGLGPYGHGELICDHLPDTPGFNAARQWYGPATGTPATGESSSVRKAGLLDYRWHRLMETSGCFVTLEFGTYSIQSLFDVVLNDHRAWKTGDSSTIRESAAAMREHFCPADVYWRELVLLKGRQVIQQAVDGLNHD